MTRRKTIGFSLKAFPAKLQRIPFSYRIAGGGFLFAVLLLNSLLIAGCAPSATITGTINTGFVHKEIEMENVRFEPQGLPGSIPTIQPAHTYWLKRGEMIAPKWDTFEWHWENQSAMMTCDFRNNTSAGNCQICNYCNPPSSTNGAPCMGYSQASVVGILRIVADPGFIQTGNPTIIHDYVDSASLLQTCDNTQNPLVFTTPMSGLYRFLGLNFKYNFVGGTDGAVKIHIVEPGLVETAAYQLKPEMIEGTNYWTWTIEVDPYWLEEFSSKLHVTDIPIFKGQCIPDPTQGRQCVLPDNRVPVRPSRILFLPCFQGSVSTFGGQAAHVCYNNTPTADDFNFIKMASCRERCDAPPMTTTCASNQINPKFVTPTYEYLPERPTEKLTWLVEFNTSEGADADLMTPSPDPMPTDAVLIIEFTIRVD